MGEGLKVLHSGRIKRSRVWSVIRVNVPRGPSFAAILDQGVSSGTRFLVAVIIGRMGSKEQLGLYALANTVVMFLSAMQNALILSAYTVYSPRLKGRALELYNGSSLCATGWTIRDSRYPHWHNRHVTSPRS